MNANEIKSFEDLWQKLWAIIYEVLAFFRGFKDNIEVGTETVNLDGINPVYPPKK